MGHISEYPIPNTLDSPYSQPPRQIRRYWRPTNRPTTDDSRALRRNYHDSGLPDRETQRLKRQNRIFKINTLDPTRLSTSDYIDLTGLRVTGAVSIRDGLSPHLHMGKDIRTWHLRHALVTTLVKAPIDGHLGGFLYYHHMGIPPLAGELRFRVTNSENPYSFALGIDYTPTGQSLPWSLPLLTLESAQYMAVLRDLLLRDRLVSQDTLDLARTHSAKRAYQGESNRITRMLYSFGQPFILRGVSLRADFQIVGPRHVVHGLERRQVV